MAGRLPKREPGNLIIRAVGSADIGYFTYVFEFKGGQLLIKHEIAKGLASISEAEAAGRAYKAQYPKFKWRE